MDHRISKDMISSGMIPSGEKKQEDLGKTQYGTVPSPNALSDVYKKMYETKEEVINEHHQKDKDGNTIPHEGEELNEGKMPAGLQAYLDKKKGKKEDKKDVKEDNIDEALPLLIAKGAAMLGKIGAIAGKGAATAAKVTTTGGKVVAGASKGSGTLAKAGNVLNKAADISFKTQMVGNMIPKPSIGAVEKKKSSGGMVSAGADLFDIVKGQLLDEGLSEEEIKDIMLTLTPDEILKEIEESSMSDGTAGGSYQDLGPGGFRSKEQINTMHNDPKGTQKYGKKIMKRVGQAVKDTGTPTVKKVDESKK